MKKTNILPIVCAIILATGTASAQEQNMQEYKTLLKRPLAATGQQMADKANIKELVAFERFSRDNALWDEMKKCYAGDSHVNISWYQGSGHGFVDASAALQGFPSAHKIYSTEIWLRGDKAVAVMMANVQMRYKIDDYPVELHSDAKLIFRTQKIDGQWCIVSFESIYEKDAIVPVYPNGKINIPLDDIVKYRESYGAMTYLATRNGMKVNQSLPGADRPDLVEKLYRETDEWLSK